MPLPSLTLPPTKCHIVRNGARIGKLEKEVLPLNEMYLLLDRRLCKLSIDTLFTPFGLQINKLGEEKRGKK